MAEKFNPLKVLVPQWCLTLCDPIDCSQLGSSVYRILQARILEWIAFPSLADLPDLGIKPRSPRLQADSLLSELPGKPGSINNWLGMRGMRKVQQGMGNGALEARVAILL